MAIEVKDQEELDKMTPEELSEYEESISEVDEPETETDEDVNDENIENQIDQDGEDEDEPSESDEEDPADDDEETEEEETSRAQDERFKDKPKEYVEDKYFKLLKKVGDQGRELGELRKLAEQRQAEPVSKEDTKIAAPEKPEFDPEEWVNLIVDDPKKAIDLLMEESARRGKQQQEAQRAEEKRVEIVTKQNKALQDFADLPEIKDMTDEEAQKFGEFLRTQTRPDPGEGYYTLESLKQRYSWFNPEKQIMQEKKKLIKTMTDSSPKVRTLSTAKTGKAKTGDIPSGDRVDVAQWAEKLTDEEMDKLLDDI